jgi:hypothetical protein
VDCGADGRWFKTPVARECLLFISGLQRVEAKIERVSRTFRAGFSEKNEVGNWIHTLRARSLPKLHPFSSACTFSTENDMGYNILKNYKNSCNRWREFKSFLEEHEFFTFE